MYCDKDSNGRAAIMDLQLEELETIRRALIAFRCGLLHNQPKEAKHDAEAGRQYERVDAIMRHIESLE